jgi:hypothetical protein
VSIRRGQARHEAIGTRMSDGPELRQGRAVAVLDHRVDHALRVDQDAQPLEPTWNRWCASMNSSPLFIIVASRR